MAILLLERKAGLEQFTDEVVNRADVQALLRRVEFGVHPEAEAAGFDKMTTIIEIELDDGRVVRGAADFGKGSPANPMSDAELSDKFRQCAAWGRVSSAEVEALLELLWRIETITDVNELTSLLRKSSDK
ncbi:MAG: MmgE/PrpD family protein, partial [Betaproteobacteria bacterium]